MRTVFLLTIATCLVSAEIQRGEPVVDPVSRQLDFTPWQKPVASSYYASLTSKPRSLGNSIVKRSKHHKHALAKVTNDPFGGNWWTQVQLGNQTVELMLDTGSSDTWVLREGFVCTNGTDVQPHSYCNDGPYFNGTFSGGQIADQNFNISYASGLFLVGQVGYESITLAGITVPQQEIGLIDYAYWPTGATGLLGLAWPILTRAWNGTNATEDGNGDPAHQELHYRSFLATMIAEKLIAPEFSLALARSDADESYIAFGGLPPVETCGKWASSPMLLDPHYSPTELSVYFIDIDTFAYAGFSSTSNKTLSGQAIIDSGSFAINVPTEIADAYTKLFDPPAINPPEVGFYIFECDAKAPKESFFVTINGTKFEIPGQDFALSGAVLSKNGFEGPYGDYCFCGMQSGSIWGEDTYLLARPFLENVVAVHDLEAKEMRFAQRKY